MELHNSPSTQSLGVNSAAGESIVFGKSNKRLVISVILACVLLLVACVILSVLYAEQITKPRNVNHASINGDSTPTPSPDVCVTSDCLRIAAVFTKNINTSVDPCEDFYHYACDGWIRDNPIPPSENEYATFFKASQVTNEKLRNLLEEATNLEVGSPERRARDYYVSCMDEREVDRTATDQIQELLRSFGSWALDNSTWNESAWDWKQSLLEIQKVFFMDSPLFTLEIVGDPTNSSKYLLKIQQSSLSLLKDQYDDTPKNNKVKDAYLTYMTEVAVLLGSDNATAYEAMKDVLELEGKLAKIIPPKRVIMKQGYDTYELRKFNASSSSSDFSWITYLNNLFSNFGITLEPSELIIVPAPSYMANMTRLVADQSKRTLSNYFGWTIIRNMMAYLSSPFEEAELRFKRKATNTIASNPRWLHCVKTADNRKGLTFAVGYLYIQRAFDKSLIPVVKTMMDDMRHAFREEVTSLSWIDKTTRRGVFDKEDAMIEKVGFPKLCVNHSLLVKYYSGLEINDKDYLLNEVNISRWYARKSLSSLRDPVNRDSWYSGPQMVNAFYLRERNEINIMAGILQPPFFYGKDAPRVVNYGGIGMVLAHELTHGFDSAGRRFNKYGEITSNLGWTNNSLAEFNKRAECIVDQYNKYEVKIDKGTIKLDGKLTLDENIADNGGFKIAFRAYQLWSKKHGPEKIVPGLKKTNEQMFFLSYAQMWCSSFTPSATFYRTKVDSHSIPKYRVIGALTNSEAFAKAYNCPVGSKMNPGPEKRCRVW